ncbi:hypothetical protein SBRY_20707 [Actinacidiphila bryophytorum]|uniref:Uncharacterized protein n=1 Tax=Actinacidiphila bryophytorum TaxID=1436133 RepID=A0A9W4E6V7_9ACTN|nr:hypothetical protein SBRY_20707 [Actinacidiphila bryophytorum]
MDRHRPHHRGHPLLRLADPRRDPGQLAEHPDRHHQLGVGDRVFRTRGDHFQPVLPRPALAHRRTGLQRLDRRRHRHDHRRHRQAERPVQRHPRRDRRPHVTGHAQLEPQQRCPADPERHRQRPAARLLGERHLPGPDQQRRHDDRRHGCVHAEPAADDQLARQARAADCAPGDKVPDGLCHQVTRNHGPERLPGVRLFDHLSGLITRT